MPTDLIADRYRVEREIGRGGMGTVWLCRDERLDRDVAVKQVGGLPGESSMHLARALREARHSAALNHPHVVAIFDALEEGNAVWLIMEYVPSRTLSEIIRSEGPLPPGRAARICGQVADGLAAAHSRGTIHRDVKPSNILVGAGDLAKISDFGIARAMDEEQLTRTGLVTGTPAYFSPEQARGEEPTPASDVWALGATLYAAVEGRPLYPEQSNAIAMLRVIAEADPPPAQHAGPLGPALSRMLEPDPTARWTMAEAAATLRGLGQAAPVDEGSTRLMEATPIAPPPAPRVATSEVDPDVAAGDAQEHTARRPAAVAVPSRRRSPALLVAVLLLLLFAAMVGGYVLARDPSSPAADPGAGETTDDQPTGSGGGSPAPTESQQPPQETADPPSTTPDPDGGEDADTGDDEPVTDAGDPAAFVSTYYSHLPDDTATSWQMLSPELQDQIGRDSYEGFWASVADVRVDDVATDGDGAVLVTLTYTSSTGTEQETRRLLVSEAEDAYLITGDQGAV